MSLYPFFMEMHDQPNSRSSVPYWYFSCSFSTIGVNKTNQQGTGINYIDRIFLLKLLLNHLANMLNVPFENIFLLIFMSSTPDWTEKVLCNED